YRAKPTIPRARFVHSASRVGSLHSETHAVPLDVGLAAYEPRRTTMVRYRLTDLTTTFASRGANYAHISWRAIVPSVSAEVTLLTRTGGRADGTKRGPSATFAKGIL